MKRLVLIGWGLMALALTACQSGMIVRSASGSSESLTALPTFVVIEPEVHDEPDEGISATGPVTTEALEATLRLRVKEVLVSRGYKPTDLQHAKFALSVEATYYATSSDMQMGGTRSFLGTGNRQKETELQQNELSVALDFIDLLGKRVAWRVTAKGPPPTRQTEAALTERVAALVAEIPPPAAQ